MLQETVMAQNQTLMNNKSKYATHLHSFRKKVASSMIQFLNSQKSFKRTKKKFKKKSQIRIWIMFTSLRSSSQKLCYQLPIGATSNTGTNTQSFSVLKSSEPSVVA